MTTPPRLSPLPISEPRARNNFGLLVIGEGDTVPPGDLWRQDMKASLLYRIASVLLLLFAIGHTLGFRQNNPEWGVGSLIDSMRSIHFDAQGFTRTYWDFFSAFGLFSPCFFCSPRYWRGSWAAFRQRLLHACAALRGRWPFALPRSQL